ncbi:MAG: TRAP transporter substrate-binding protein DctP [Burkholderiales bacterium]
MTARWYTGMLAALVALLAFGSAASAEEVVLKTQTALPANHDLSKSFISSFVEPLNARGKGVVRVDYLGGPEINPPDKAAPALQRGAIDLLHSPAAYQSGLVPQGSTMMATNLGIADLRANGAVDLLTPNWEKKLNAKVLAIGETSAQFYLYLTDKPKLRPDGVIDLKGVKIRTTGAYRPLIEALGGTPVQITNAGEVYTALERGLVGGFGWPTVGLASQNLAGLVKYRVDPPFYHLANVLLINLDKWKSMPKAAQDLLMSVAAEYEKASIDNMLRAAKVDEEAVKKAGVQVFSMNEQGTKKYLDIAYEAMWKRAGARLDKGEAGTLRAKMYKN